MFSLAILIGIYSYLIFALGLLGLIYKQNVIILTLTYLIIVFLYYKNTLINIGQWVKSLNCNSNTLTKIHKTEKLIFVLILLIVLQIKVNLIGVLGPEISFDALWYHLTLPKIFMENHSVFYIPGGLLYYSVMPKLTEMLYMSSMLLIQSEIVAKFIHFSFGILTLIALYNLSRNYLSRNMSLVVLVIFYSNLVVGWETVTAYIDLSRAFFEIMAFWGFLNWWKKQERKWLIESAVMLGLAISVKLLALGSLFIFITLIIYKFHGSKEKIHSLALNILTYCIISIGLVIPWFVFSYLKTGNPVYPLFTNMYNIGFDISLISPIRFINDIWVLFTRSADPVSPIYIIFLPLVFLFFNKFGKEMKVIGIYSFLSVLVWYFTPQTGGGRFLLPYLPALSLFFAGIIQEVIKEKKFKIITIGLVILVSLISITYRGLANAKYVPVIFGKETRNQFLEKNLNFNFGDFLDVDGYFKTRIMSNDKVLLYGFHNLYYVDFPYIDSSWVQKGDKFNYIAVQNSELPERFKYWNLLYQNHKTNVELYSAGGQEWVY